MVIAALLACTMAAAPARIAVARGDVAIGEPRRPAGAGAEVHPGLSVETGPTAWAELHLPGGTRLRISAGTQLTVVDTSTAGQKVELSSGRIWLQLPAPRQRATFGAVVSTPAGRGWIAPGASAIAEYGPRSGAWLVVRRGLAELGGHLIAPGQVGRIEAGKTGAVYAGGMGAADLAGAEARGALADPAGFETFLLAAVATAPIGRLDVRRSDQILRLDPEITGSSAGPVGGLLEEALRPAPFFDEEVPPRGPNVEVEVEFAE
jgi:hypothetical protein